MYKVLKEDKTHTMVKSELGDIKVDKDFMEKEITKHLDNPNLRGMVTTKEMLSFPKVAKGVEAEYDERYQGYSWRVKANDGSILNYGERDYGNGHRLLTAHSKTGRDERGQLRREFNDRNFHNPADEIIPQKIDEAIKKQKAFIGQMLQKQESISSIPRVEEFLKEETKQEAIKHTPRQRIKK